MELSFCDFTMKIMTVGFCQYISCLPLLNKLWNCNLLQLFLYGSKFQTNNRSQFKCFELEQIMLEYAEKRKSAVFIVYPKI